MSATKTLEAKLKGFIGAPVEYTKKGGRFGWKGRIVSLDTDNKKVNILFENETLQPYSYYALDIGEKLENEWDHDSRYVKVIFDGKSTTTNYSHDHKKQGKNPLPHMCFLVVNMATGEVIGTETDKGEAETFAYEAAMDSTKRETFAVFAPQARFAIKRPVVERLKEFIGLGEKNGES